MRTRHDMAQHMPHAPICRPKCDIFANKINIISLTQSASAAGSYLLYLSLALCLTVCLSNKVVEVLNVDNATTFVHGRHEGALAHPRFIVLNRLVALQAAKKLVMRHSFPHSSSPPNFTSNPSCPPVSRSAIESVCPFYVCVCSALYISCVHTTAHGWVSMLRCDDATR